MLKEKLFYLLVTLFFGILFVYTMSKPKTVIVQNPKLKNISNVKFIDDDTEDDEIDESCKIDN
jgi:hypothetical protein